ncbi:hypothetical protein JD969_08555 [Planctomycetota bacterium]|nr:hypothetical protein JD969_08555 [Planctomycetota bacterium]
MKKLSACTVAMIFIFIVTQLTAQTSEQMFMPEKRIYPYSAQSQDTTEFYLRPYRSWVKNGFPFYASRDSSVRYPSQSLMWNQSYWRKGQKESGSILLASKKRGKPGKLSEASKLNRYPGDKNSYLPYPEMDVYEFIENVRLHRANGTAEKALGKLALGHSGDNAMGGWAELDPLNHTGFYYMPRSRMGHLMQYESFLDIYARYSDYQQRTEFNSWGALNQPTLGYAASLQWQEENRRRHHIINFSMLRAMKYEAPFRWVMDTNPRIVPSAKNKEGEVQKLEDLLMKGKKASYRQRNRCYVPGGDSASHAPLDVWTGYAMGYLSGADIYTSQYGLAIEEAKPLYRDISKNLFVRYPDPGGHYSPIAYMHDIYTGWQTVRDTYWRKFEPTEGDWSYELLFAALYPSMHPHSKDNVFVPDQLQAFSHTPYGGDLVNTITTKTPDAMLSRYSMIVFATDLNAHAQTLRDKMERYVEGGGNFIVSAGIAKKMWPEWGLQPTNAMIDGDVTINGSTINEPLAFRLWSGKNLPTNNTIVHKDGSAVMVEIPMGKGAITLSLSSYGLAPYENAPVNPKFAALKHLEAVLQVKAKSLQLFDFGESNDKFMVSATRDDKGTYTVVVANRNHNEQPCVLDSEFGKAMNKEIRVGNPQPIIKTNLAYHVPESFEYEKPESPKKYNLLGMKAGSKAEAKKIADDVRRANQQLEKQARTKFDQYMTTIEPGKTSSKTIVGGGIRVFQTKLKNEDSFNVIEKYKTPKRRPRWYIATTPWSLRQRLYVMPNFWEYFAGIHITAQNLLDWNDANIDFEYAWLTVRHVEFIVDARDVESPEKLKKIMGKMSKLAYAKWLILKGEPTPAINSLARRFKIEIINNEQYVYLNAATQINDKLRDKLNNPKTIKVIDSIQLFSTYEDWDNLYSDYRQWKRFAENKSQEIKIRQIKAELPKIEQSYINQNRSNQKYYHLGLSFHDIPALLKKHPEILKQPIKGFVCNTFYAFSRSPERMKREIEYLDSLGLELVIDLSNNIGGGGSLLTFSPFPHYGVGDDVFFATIESLGKAGVKNIIINAPNRRPVDYRMLSRYGSQYKIQGLSKSKRNLVLKECELTFEERSFRERLDAMNQYGLKIHLRDNLKNIKNADADGPITALQQVWYSEGKVKKDDKKSASTKHGVPQSQFCLLKDVDFQPAHIAKISMRKHDKTLYIFDSEYLSVDELIRDIEFTNR